MTRARPGTFPVPSPLIVTSRRVTIAWANVATNSPIAIWLGLSCRSRWTIRGENCPIASWTTTMVIVSTMLAMLTIDAAIVDRIGTAASGPPVMLRGMSWYSKRRSIAIVET